MDTLNTFQQWQVNNGHHVTENVDGDEVHAPELCPLCTTPSDTHRSPEASRIDRVTREALRLGVITDSTYEAVRLSMVPSNGVAGRVIDLLDRAVTHRMRGDGAMAAVYARAALALNNGVEA